jgi:UDP-N-acetylglucosamine 4,6-dehydratase/5-epimerase
MKRILITGGTGYLGRNLALFYKKKYKVFLGARNNKQNFLVKNLTNCEAVPLDVSNINSVNDCLNYTRPDIVIHAAATKFVDLSEKFPFECIDTNILGSTNVARACLNKKIPTVIGISTDKASPPIKNIYGLSKSLMERLFCSSNPYGKTKFVCVRYGNVAWSTGSVLPIWKQMFNKNKMIHTTGPNMRRFFFSVDEAVSLVDQALKLKDKLNGKILSAEMKSAKMIEILKVWIKKFGGKYKVIKGRKGDRLDEYLIGEDELKYTQTLNINNKKYFVIDFNEMSKKPLKKIVSSQNAKRLSQSEIEKIIRFGINNNDL